MSNKIPKQISNEEWMEIMQVRDVRDGWGIDDDTTVRDFTSTVYGVKFDFVSGGPGYIGDLFILQGDSLETPLVLIRTDGTLKRSL